MYGIRDSKESNLSLLVYDILLSGKWTPEFCRNMLRLPSKCMQPVCFSHYARPNILENKVVTLQKYFVQFPKLSSSLLSKNLKIKIYRTIILPVVLYGCGTWSLTLREEHRQRVFENRVLRRIFGPKWDGVTGECRKLHNEELNDLYSSPNIVRVINSRRMRWAGHVARMEKGRGVHKVLVGKSEG